MSFAIELGYTNSAMNVVDKDFFIIDNPSGVLKVGSSVIDPVIIVLCDASDAWRKNCNYAHIDEFGRWYYITDIVMQEGTLNTDDQFPNPKQLIEFHMHVDVLKTYADQIKAQTAVVARQEGKYNLMLDDGFFMSYQNPKIQTKLFSVPDPFEQQEFVLIVAGS